MAPPFEQRQASPSLTATGFFKLQKLLVPRRDENSRELKMASYRIICPSWIPMVYMWQTPPRHAFRYLVFFFFGAYDSERRCKYIEELAGSNYHVAPAGVIEIDIIVPEFAHLKVDSLKESSFAQSIGAVSCRKKFGFNIRNNIIFGTFHIKDKSYYSTNNGIPKITESSYSQR
ncbi:hypothetical protein EJB05_57783, partial [Eragrostis curvula]